MSLLRQMDVAVRGPGSVLADDQVARTRLRWEREKRHRAEKASAPAAPARRKKAATDSAPVTTAPAAEVTAPGESEVPEKVTKPKAEKPAKATKAAKAKVEEAA